MPCPFLLVAILLAAPPYQAVSGLRPDPVPPRADAAAITMTKMRLASTLIGDRFRQTGAYVDADGRMRLVADVLAGDGLGAGRSAWLDGWGRPLRVRAVRGVHQVISFGADGAADTDYDAALLYAARWWRITDASEPGADLVLVDGRFVKRPFGDRRREFETVNAMNAIYVAAASYAVDANHYPGETSGLQPVAALEAELVPVYIRDLPRVDGWGRALLYSSSGQRFQLVSYGTDGAPDIFWYDQMTCDRGWVDPGPSPVDGGDIIQMCGEFAYWSRGLEP